VSGTPKLLARIKALFEPTRPTPPAPEAEVALIPAAAAPEIAETSPEPPTLFEEPQPTEDVPASAIETLPVAVEAPPLREVASTEDQPMSSVATPEGLTLRLESERGSRSTFEVTKSGATIGRGPESTIQLADLSVSRKHARITYKQGSYWLSDLGSMGGTWIDGAKLAAPRRVAAGQTIDIGLCRLVVVAAAEGEKSGAAKGSSNGA
jgi:FHA domain-containing protein